MTNTPHTLHDVSMGGIFNPEVLSNLKQVKFIWVTIYNNIFYKTLVSKLLAPTHDVARPLLEKTTTLTITLTGLNQKTDLAQWSFIHLFNQKKAESFKLYNRCI